MDKTNVKIIRKRKWQITRINVFLIIARQWYRTNTNIQSDKMLFFSSVCDRIGISILFFSSESICNCISHHPLDMHDGVQIQYWLKSLLNRWMHPTQTRIIIIIVYAKWRMGIARVVDGFLDGVAIDVNRFQIDVHTNVYQCIPNSKFLLLGLWFHHTKWNTYWTLYAAHGCLTVEHLSQTRSTCWDLKTIWIHRKLKLLMHIGTYIVIHITKILDGTIIDLDYMNLKRGHCGRSLCYSSREIFDIVINDKWCTSVLGRLKITF